MIFDVDNENPGPQGIGESPGARRLSFAAYIQHTGKTQGNTSSSTSKKISNLTAGCRGATPAGVEGAEPPNVTSRNIVSGKLLVATEKIVIAKMKDVEETEGLAWTHQVQNQRRCQPSWTYAIVLKRDF